jgi:hypothetical protein
MESKLEQKYSEMSKDIAIREREREMENLQKKHELDERDDRLKQMYKDFDSSKEKEMMEIAKKIKTTHELIKTVMHLHQDDISNFDGVNESKDSHPPNFSFDISKQVKINESQNSNQDSEEKDKIIIREPLEVFEIDDDLKQMNSPDKDLFHDSSDDKILKAYHPGDKHSRNSDTFPNVFMSPKFKSFEDNQFNGEKLNIDSSNKKSTDNSRDDQLQSQRFSYGAIDFENESSNQREIRKKSRVSHLIHPESPEAEEEELDYKARLRQSLMASFKPKPSKTQINKKHDNDDIASDNSSKNAQRKNERSHSPLNENYNDFEEFTTNYKKKQQEILDEFNSINKNNFHLVNQLANNLNSEDEGEQHSQNSVRMSNKEIEFDPKVTLTLCLTIYLGWAFSLRD